MDAPSQQSWFNAALLFLIGCVAGFFELYRRKVDRLEDRQGTYITREELQKYLDQIRGDRIQMHVENLQRLDRIDDAMIRIHDRIDKGLHP